MPALPTARFKISRDEEKGFALYREIDNVYNKQKKENKEKKRKEIERIGRKKL